MTDIAQVETLPDKLTSALDTVDPTALDCLQSSVAVVADWYHGPGTFSRMGAHLRFRPRPTDDALWTIEAETEPHLSAAVDAVGIRFTDTIRGADEARSAARTSLLLCVADAYELPWLPYFRREHMDHSFLLTSGDDASALMIDVYRNDTVHGPAEPTARRTGWKDLEPIMHSPRTRTTAVVPGTLPELQPRMVLRDNAQHLNDPHVPVVLDRYIEAYRTHPDQVLALRRMTLETWLLARSRQLHALWLQRAVGFRAARPAADHAKRCSDVSARAFFALRRVQAGRKASDVHHLLHELLADEAALARDLDLR
ncbi:hypothetical protein [Actinokineospora sp. UTMC 2448]|uniref:hypothetical protein n=1 Tax=Actinokineospora sp. UTMC 2448 TaxID=2268449 RepID=UPI0021647349|nr:hypothetical protein [Actinokineospora sp. UTMC 2448]